ncbi:hypothetical protein DYL61_12460 [Pseudomonas nabeulensis]|uniref:Uncharacterized protein n=1 Tax=Pseudomonas nabeulensis TaxID=2293833 RepID=A0A4Z0B4T5_9PSED|nr:hypothetical protein DYL61_12460 [Pseudomonas nabeulensis]
MHQIFMHIPDFLVRIGQSPCFQDLFERCKYCLKARAVFTSELGQQLGINDVIQRMFKTDNPAGLGLLHIAQHIAQCTPAKMHARGTQHLH